MPTVTRSSNMPPVKPMPEYGTMTSNRWGQVISTRPLPAPQQPTTNASGAPTCDRWGNIISGQPARPTTPIPGTNFIPNSDGVVTWK